MNALDQTAPEAVEAAATAAIKKTQRKPRASTKKADKPKVDTMAILAKKEEAKAEEAKANPVPTVFRLKRMPRGGALFLYQIAALKAVGGFGPKHPAFKEEDLSRLFIGKLHIKNMLECNLIKQLKNGTLQMTKEGYSYMNARLTGNATVSEKNIKTVDLLVEAINTGKWGGGFSSLLDTAMVAAG